MPRLFRTPRAEADLEDIWLYVAQDDLTAADGLLDEFHEKLQILASHPQLGPARPDIARQLRYFPVRNYLLLYREIADGIELVRVIHGARRIQDLL